MDAVEIIFVGPHNMHNSLAALRLGKEYMEEGKKIVFMPLPTLNEVGYYVKTNHFSVGVISYYSSFERIKSKGIDIINKHNLFINGARRIHLENQEIKDYLILSSGHGFVRKFPVNHDKNWATLIIVEKLNKNFKLSDVAKTLLDNKISYSYSKLKFKDYNFYLEVDCHGEKLKFLSSLPNCRVKILGSYEIPETGK